MDFKVRGFKPGRGRWSSRFEGSNPAEEDGVQGSRVQTRQRKMDFYGYKNPSQGFVRRGSKAGGPMS
jgi:hypothetical protein